MAKSTRTVFQLGALVLLLIVFPAASWYYLNSGLQYRRTAMSELKAYGHFPDQSWTLVNGDPLSPDFLQKKMLVAYVLPDRSQDPLTGAFGQTLKQLHDQFDERDELVFLTVFHGEGSEMARSADQFTENFGLTDEEQLFFVGVNEPEFAGMQKSIFQPKPGPADEPGAFFLLTDTTSTIRRYYDVRQESEVKRLVEHIALLLPLKKDRELIFKREVEK